MLSIENENVATPLSSYTWGYHLEQSPMHMDYVARLQGIDRPPFGDAFTYCDLGCGNGMTVNMLATILPQGEFYGIDINPEHIKHAADTASAIGIKNAHFIEASFNALTDNDQHNLPQFDYIALHGIISWVNDAVFAEIIALVKKLLKPTGIIYVSYNAMPACAKFLPLSHLFKTLANACSFSCSKDDEEKNIVALTLDVGKEISALDNSFFNGEDLKTELKRLTYSDPSYVIHEYVVESWRPFYFNEVAKKMSAAGLVYTGSATLKDNYWESSTKISKEMSEALESFAGNSTLTEQLGDYIGDKRFRRDIYMHADTQPLTNNEERQNLINQVYVHSRHTNNWKSDDVRKLAHPKKLTSYAKRILEIAATGAHKIGDIVNRQEFDDYDPDIIRTVIEQMVGKNLLALALDPSINKNNHQLIKAFNQYAIELHYKNNSKLYLLSPVLGLGLGMEKSALFILYAKYHLQNKSLVDALHQVCSEKKISYTKDGKPIDDKTELQQLITNLCSKFENNLLPYLQELGIL